MPRFRFGCSGWDYQEWIGPFYRNASESKLRAYARVFDTAEINSTFYRAPSPGMVQGWGRFTPDEFVFAAKVPQTVTHDRLLDVAAGADKDLDDDGGVRSLAVHGGRIHHCGRAAAAAGPPCDVPDRLPPLARPRLRSLVQLSLFRGRIEELGPTGSTSCLAVADRFQIFQQPFPWLCAGELHPDPPHARPPNAGPGARVATDRRIPQAGHPRRRPFAIGDPRGFRGRGAEGRPGRCRPRSPYGPESFGPGKANRLKGCRGDPRRRADPCADQGVPGRDGSCDENDPPRLRGLGQARRAKGLVQARRQVLLEPAEGRGPVPPRGHHRRSGCVDLLHARFVVGEEEV